VKYGPGLGPGHAGLGESLTLELGGGRRLGYAVFGAADGAPFICWHGAPASRLMFKAAGAAALKHGLKLIAFDRPSAGLTSPHPELTIEARIADAAALVAALGLDQFGLIGISGGGPYAAHMATLFGRRITALALISPVGPLDDPIVKSGLSLNHQRFFLGLPRWQRPLRLAAGISRHAFLASPFLNHRVSLAMLHPADRSILRQPWVRDSLIEMTREALRQGAGCGIDDLTIYSRPWQTDLTKIAAPAMLWQGLADTIVPPVSALALGARIPGCEIRKISDAGHFWIYDHIDEVLGVVGVLARNRDIRIVTPKPADRT
jgi:pimeloyl-ACP methyl ester carboxylesterase